MRPAGVVLLLGVLLLVPLRPVWAGERIAGPLVAAVVRVVDGDTFEAQVRIWLGLSLTTKVRVRGIDTPEVQGQCAQERALAAAATVALAQLLAQQPVLLWAITPYKFGGAVVADVGVGPSAQSVAEAMVQAGHARPYDGQRPRAGWCP